MIESKGELYVGLVWQGMGEAGVGTTIAIRVASPSGIVIHNYDPD